MSQIKVAVFPFNNLSSRSLDLRQAAVITAELSRNEFLEPVSAEIVRTKIYEYELAFALAGKQGTDTGGAMLWKIEPKIVERVQLKMGVDATVSGEVSHFKDKWVITVYLRTAQTKSAKVFTLTGDKEEEMPKKLIKTAGEIASFMRRGSIEDEAEEEVRRYLAGMYGLATVIGRVEKLSGTYTNSIPLYTILVNLYLRDEAAYRKKIMEASRMIIDLYNPSRETDTRFLRTHSLDPYDLLAGIYEANGEWEKAVGLREKALEVFSFNEDDHKAGIGRDALALAEGYEKRGLKSKATAYYKKAFRYLSPSSPGHTKAGEKLNIPRNE